MMPLAVEPPTSMTDERHMKQVKSVLEYTCSIFCMEIATEVRIFPASICHILTSSLGKRTVCERWIPHVLNDAWRFMHFFLPLPICGTGKIKTLHSLITWWDMDAFIWPEAKIKECWMACPNVTKEENCTMLLGCSESYAHHVLQLKWTCSWPSHANWYDNQHPVLLHTLGE